MRPRDIFDIAAAGEHHEAQVIAALRPYRLPVTEALAVIDRLNPEFVNNAIAQLLIRPEFSAVAKTALARATQILRMV